MELPNKFLDCELHFMKEIRETYFEIKAEDISDDEGYNQSKPYEISENLIPNYRSSTASNTRNRSINPIPHNITTIVPLLS
jgi:hypothetical protein